MMISAGQPAHLTVVIPAYNEEKRIGPTLERICGYLEKRSYPWEIVVVNDGSRDGTVQIARELLAGCEHHTVIDRKFNRGKGYSVRQGMLAGLIGINSDRIQRYCRIVMRSTFAHR